MSKRKLVKGKTSVLVALLLPQIAKMPRCHKFTVGNSG